MGELLLSGKTTFRLEVPFRLYEAGENGSKPLLIYLHGFGENMERAVKAFNPLQDIKAYHLMVQGPYPIFSRFGKKHVSEWGRSWYLYDGTQQTFVDSMEQTSEFLQQLIDDLQPHLDVERIGLVGYSMGGYLAGYFAFSRWKYIHDVVAVACRLKVELFEQQLDQLSHQHILALHGAEDQKVLAEPQQKSVEKLYEAGVDASFKMFENVGHKMDPSMLVFTRKWLTKVGYQLS